MLILVICVFAVPTSLFSQQTATPLSVLQGALAALGGTNLQAIAMSGNTSSIAGSTEDSGSVTASCATGGISQVSLQFSGGSRTESRQIANGIPSGSWTGSDGEQHAMVPHNLYSPASWFCPLITLQDIVSGSNLNIQFIGDEEKNGATLAHFVITDLPAGTGPSIAFLTHISQVDLFLDPQTFRPIVVAFPTHADKDGGIDIAIEMRFSNYTQVSGVWLPFTIERYLNHAPALTLQIQTATPSLTTALPSGRPHPQSENSK
jgi:hypothetical protein